MQILSVELENVKSYEHLTVEFAPGVNAIVGHNGAGKSTIVEAIGFVLFNTLGYRQEDFVRAGANFGRVAVAFLSSLDERRYVAVRRIGASSAYFINDPELGGRLAEGNADVQRWLRQHLRLEAGANLGELFTDAVGVPQGTLTASFLLSEGPRKKVFDALLQVQDYQRASDRLLPPVNLLKERKGEVNLEIASSTARLERLPTLREAVAQRKGQIAQIERDLTAATTELATVQTTNRRLDEARDQMVAAERALSQARERRQGLAARRMTAAQAVADAAAAAAIVAANEDGFARYVAAQQAQAELDVQVRTRQQLERQRGEAQTRLAGSAADIRHLEQELAAIAEAAALAASLRPAVALQDETEQALTAAKVQQAQLDTARKALQRQTETVQQLTQHLAETEAQVGRAETIRAEQTVVEQQIQQSQAAVDGYREEKQELTSRANVLKEQSERLNDVQTAVCPVCEQPLTEHHRAELLDRNTAALQELRERYRVANGHLDDHTSRLQAHQARVKQLQADLLSLARSGEVLKAREELTRGQAALDEATARVAELAGAADQVAVLQARLNELGDPRGRFRVAQARAGQADAANAKLAAVQKTVAAAEHGLAELADRLAAYAGLDARLEEVAATLKAHQAAHQAVVEHRRQAEALAGCEAELAGLTEQEDAAVGTLAAAEQHHQAAAARFDPTAFAAAAAREQELRQQVGTLRGQHTLLTEQQGREEQEIASLQALSATLIHMQARLATLEDEERALESIRTFLRRAGPYITQALTRQISEGARQIFSDLMQDYSRHLAWNDDYGITLEVDGHKRQFGQLSGGEQMSAALSVRLALLREMSGIDVAFFDEPTTNLDETRREALARLILQVRGFQQLFVISHDDTFEQATQNLVRVECHNGASHVSYG